MLRRLGATGVAGLDARQQHSNSPMPAAPPISRPSSLRLAQWQRSRGSTKPRLRTAASAPGAAGPWQPWQGPVNSSSSGAATPGQPSPYSSPIPSPAPSPPPPPHQQAGATASAATAAGAAAATPPTPPNAAPPNTAKEGEQQQEEPLSGNNFHLKPVHILLFSLIFVGGAAFATITLQFTAGMEFRLAVTTVLRRVAKSAAFRQLVVIGFTVILLRFGLNNLMQTLAKFSLSPVQWDKTKLYYLLREVYQPLELLLFVAALCTISDAFLPSLIAIPKATVSHVVKSILSTSFIIGFASVVFNLKSRFCKENAWQAEMKGDATSQRRWEAYDKLGTFVIFVMSIVLGIQAMGLEVGSVLAIGGIGGLAIGLAGREICENLLSGFLIMSTNPFEVGDEVTFFHNNKVIEGIVADIGWYRTLIRSFEREMFVIPNAVFSKNIVLNVTRKGREWRFLDVISIRVQDVQKANPIAQDIRRIMRSDPRVMNKLHRRVFVDKITKEDVQIYMSFYLDAANRDAFMAIKQDLMVSFVDCVERNGAKLATPRTVLDLDPEMIEALDSLNVHGYAAYAMARDLVAQKQQAQVVQPAAQLPSPPVITAEITDVDRPPNGPSGNGSSNGNGSGNGMNSGSGAAASAGGSSHQNGGVNGAGAGNGAGVGSNGHGHRVVSGEVVTVNGNGAGVGTTHSSSTAAGSGSSSSGSLGQQQQQPSRSGTPSGGRGGVHNGEKVGGAASTSGPAHTGAPQSYSSATNHYIPTQHHAGPPHQHHASGPHAQHAQHGHGAQGVGVGVGSSSSSGANGQGSSGLERGSGSDKQPHRVGEVYSTHTTAGVLQVPSSGEPVAYAANIATAQNNVVSGPSSSSTSPSPLRPSSSTRDSGSSRDSGSGSSGPGSGSSSSGGGGGGGVGVASARESRAGASTSAASAELDLIEAEAAAEQRRVHIVDRGVVAWAGEGAPASRGSAVPDASWGSGGASSRWSVGPSPVQASPAQAPPGAAGTRDAGYSSSGGGVGSASASWQGGSAVPLAGGGGASSKGVSPGAGGGVQGGPQRGVSGAQGGAGVQGGGVQSAGGGAAALSFNPAAAGAAPGGSASVSQGMAQSPPASSAQSAQDAARQARQQAAESQTSRDFSSSTPPGPTGLPLRWLRRLATMMFNE